MIIHSSISEAAAALAAYIFTTTFPNETIQTKAREAAVMRSPVDLVVNGVEALYAALKADELDANGVAALYSGANQIALSSFHGKGDRAAQIMVVCRFKAGEIADEPTWPEVESGFAPGEVSE